MANRAILFIDGNNWYHSLKSLQLQDLMQLDYAAISRKLVGTRDWIGTRYYIGRVRQQGNVALYAAQRSFLSKLQGQDSRISVHLGRLEPRSVKNAAALELRQYLSNLKVRLDRAVFRSLMTIATTHAQTDVMVEKAVDVMPAVDMVVMAERDEYDTAYLLSADGDFTPAVSAAKTAGKGVFAVSPNSGAQSAAVVHSFIPLKKGWFVDCYET